MPTLLTQDIQEHSLFHFHTDYLLLFSLVGQFERDKKFNLNEDWHTYIKYEHSAKKERERKRTVQSSISIKTKFISHTPCTSLFAIPNSAQKENFFSFSIEFTSYCYWVLFNCITDSCSFSPLFPFSVCSLFTALCVRLGHLWVRRKVMCAIEVESLRAERKREREAYRLLQ